MKRYFFLILMLFITKSQAKWYQTEGYAPIISNNKEQALKEAFNQALKEALLESGAHISSNQSILNGQLTNDKFNIYSDAELRHHKIMAHKYTKDQAWVMVRFDIYPKKIKVCNKIKVKTQLLISNISNTRKSEEFVNQDIKKSIMNQLVIELQKNKDILYDNNIKEYEFPINESGQPILNYQEIRNIEQENGNQYIVNIIIDKSHQRNKNANLTLNINVIDLYNRKIIDQQKYPFNSHSPTVNKDIQSMIKNWLIDIKSIYNCLIPEAKIIKIVNHQIYIKMGSQNNIKIGQIFQPYFIKENKRFLEYYQEITPSEEKVQVINVQNYISILEPLQTKVAIPNLQINDKVRLDIE